ncbi:MAG TPA: CpsD/CapB family tyrosine-protein kinase [Spongiibacteraceae bacterium]|nr:CpsD/CapB family tyrosine-protein kinase [Spongiibacteraceae bacterium]
MDYIQQAIDKARKEREGNIGKPREAHGHEGLQGRQPGGDQGMPESISYTQTRQVALSEEHLRDNRVIAGVNADKRGEAYRQLRTQVLQKMRANGWKTLAITSPNENAGKTLTAINLAISLSREVNQTVLLVDLDLYNPSVASTLGIDVQQGLIDHLSDGTPVADLLINPGLERLVVLPGRKTPNVSSEILSSPAMKQLYADLTSRYESRLIIADLPSLLINDDAMAFAPKADCVLLVVEEGGSTQAEIERCLQLLEGNNLIGTILNKADT